MILNKMKEDAKRVPNFGRLPVTAQIAILYGHIEEARSLGIPLPVICEAMTESGSTVTVRYLREALSVVRRRMRKQHGSQAPQMPVAVVEDKPVKPNVVNDRPVKSKSKTRARDEKADRYMGNMNPLLKNQTKE